MALVFDVETDGLLDTLSKLHCLVILDTDTGKLISCADVEPYTPIHEGLKMLQEAPTIVGHNVLTFDIPAIQKLWPKWAPKGEVLDTLILSRLIVPEIAVKDYAIERDAPGTIPHQLIGKHSLRAWGYRLGILKGRFSETTDWAEWSKDMQEYCEQDVRITAALYSRLMATNPSPVAVTLEHEFQKIIFKQERFGFAFDVQQAEALYRALSKRRAELTAELQKVFPPKEIRTEFIPKVNNKAKGYVKGRPCVKVSYQEFNPCSRLQIAERLREAYGWTPTAFTQSGAPEISEEILSGLPWPEAKLLTEYLMLEKRIGQLAEGNAAWLKLVKDGRIHGHVITNGAVTGRCTHNSPNIAQVPAADPSVPYGKECRQLFGPGEGYLQVGCDASGLELRCLAHYMARYDGGAYAQILLEGDIHTANQEAAGLTTRAEAKRFIYAFLYGAGNQKLGSILKPHAPEAEQQRAGKRAREKFLKALPALRNLINDVQSAARSRGWLKGLDGRRLYIRSAHAALNTLLQSAGAIVMKQATVQLWEDLAAAGFTFGKEVAQLAHIHDEVQLAVRPGLEDFVGETAVEAIRKAGRFFGFRCPLDGEYKVGRNWAETH